MRDSSTSDRVWLALSACALIPTGMASKFYSGPGSGWVHGYGGGVVYEVFFCLAGGLISNAVPGRIALTVFGTTCLLEFSQLWQPPFLEWLRSTWVGIAMLGSSFDWLDFPHYGIGCVLGFTLLRQIDRRRE